MAIVGSKIVTELYDSGERDTSSLGLVVASNRVRAKNSIIRCRNTRDSTDTLPLRDFKHASSALQHVYIVSVRFGRSLFT